MPISIQQPVPPVLGPGLVLNVHTDSAGPIPGDWSWHIRILRQGEEQDSIFLSGPIRTDIQQNAFVVIGQDTPGWTQTVRTTVGLADNTPVNVVVDLVDTLGTVHDTGSSQAYTWDSTTNLWSLINQAASGGFKETDRQQLADVHTATQVLGLPTDLVLQTASGLVQTTLAAIFSRKTLDQLTLAELTAGETCEPVRASIAGWFFGVIVRVTQIDPNLTPKTPDAQWYFPDLAVLRVFRGADLEYRRGIHTPTFMQEQPWQWGWSFLNETQILGVPPDITVAVDWRPGCCGQVFVQYLP